jgi:hypothetical protein
MSAEVDSYFDALEHPLKRGARCGPRLNSHASGRRSGDQFNVYVADRLVLPSIPQAQVAAIADAFLSFDGLVRDYIREHLGFRCSVTSTGAEALEVERTIRAGALQAGPPFLNPASR